MTTTTTTTTTITKDTQQLNPNILCIPRVFPNIRESRIHSVINELNMCKIEKIDMVQKTGEKGEKFNRVFIHIKEWYQNNTNAKAAQERLKEGKDIKIIYDDPWFWKVSAYRKPQYQNKQDQQHKQQPRFYNKKKPHMVIEHDDKHNKHNKQDDEDAKIDMLINEMMMNTNSPNSPPPKAVTLKKRVLNNVRKDPPKILSVINPDDIMDNKDLNKDNKESNK